MVEKLSVMTDAQKDTVWQLVPINPTYQMMAHALVACPVVGLSINAMYPMYAAMLAAAPSKQEQMSLEAL